MTLITALALLVCVISLPARGQSASPILGQLGCAQLDFAYEQPQVELDDRIYLQADEALLSEDGLSSLSGAVRFRQGNRVFSADSMAYDDAANTVTVKSRSLFRNPDLIIESQEAHFDLENETGQFLDTGFTLPGRAARGGSSKIRIGADGVVRLESAHYTTCAPGADDWSIQASAIKLDHASGLGSARGAKLRFMGVPFLYLPYFQFPIDDRRRTGLLYPTLGQTSGAGFDLRVPIYINLAANYDATVTPRFLSDRGLQGAVSGRYLTNGARGNARFEYLDDRDFADDRSLVEWNHDGLINQRMSLHTVYTEVSDPNYFEHLGGTLSNASITHLEQTALLTYQSPGAYSITALAQNFQSIASNLTAEDDPYKRLPQIRLETITPRSWRDTRVGLDAEFVNFSRDDSVEGGRLILAPSLRFDQNHAAWYIKGRADLHHTQYELSGNFDGDDQKNRSLPIVSAESGLRFERVTSRNTIQSLVTRGNLLYVPYEDQDDLPLFDTGEPDFDFVQLFARNRFSGEDRIADARQVAGSATLRELDPRTGHTRWSASLGQIYRLKTPRVGLPDLPPPDRGAAELIGQVDYRLGEHWNTVVAGQWSPEDENIERSHLGLRYRGANDRKLLNLSYRYRRDVLEQADVSFQAPIWGPWSIAARTRYSLEANQSRENFVGVEYSTCCWGVRVSYRRYIADVTGSFDNAIYFQLQLKGLASIGAGGDTLLPDSEIDGDRPQ